jgi:hypothetical protein
MHMHASFAVQLAEISWLAAVVEDDALVEFAEFVVHDERMKAEG